MKNLFAALEFKNQKVLRNRVVVPPMASETADLNGFVTEKTLEHYGRLAQSQAGLVMVEYSYVHEMGKSEENQLGVNLDSQVEGLTKIAATIHAQGAIAAIQLTHAGGKTDNLIKQSPSGIEVPVKDKNLGISDVMNAEDIEIWKKSFVHGARRAFEAGFDMIEIHAAHGYGINQWLSPLTNKRTDKYQDGALLLLEIIDLIQKRFPTLLISVRMPGQDFLEGGLTHEDSALIAKRLENAGVDIINVSSGIGGWRRPRDRNGEGYLVDEASFIASHVSVPVIGVGGIETSSYINQIIQQNNIALAAVGRAILKDPLSWGRSNLYG